MRFITLHCKGIPELVNIDMVYKFVKAIKGNGSYVIDGSGENSVVDETLGEIAEMLTEIDIEVIKGAND